MLITVLKAAPTVNWANPADIVYGTALGASQLDATASVPGNFVYTPGAGFVLNAGSGQPLSATFTPTDADDYSTATATAQINVAQAATIVTWTNPADIFYGTALVAMELDATASQPGTFTYTPAAGTVLSAGSDQALSVAFTPSDTADYSPATGSAQINVLIATPAVTWANPADIIYGTPLGSTQSSATSPVPGTFAYSPVAGTVLYAGNNQTLSVTLTPTDNTDYSTATVTGRSTSGKRPQRSPGRIHPTSPTERSWAARSSTRRVPCPALSPIPRQSVPCFRPVATRLLR